MALNMAKMRKIAGDKKTSTFQHEDGHTMTILHSALPALMRKQIEKMECHGGMMEKVEKKAEGGSVLPKYMHPPKNPKMEAVPRLAMAKGGEAKMYFDGTESGPVAQDDSSPTQATVPNQDPNMGLQDQTLGQEVDQADLPKNVPQADVGAISNSPGPQVPNVTPDKSSTMMNPNGTTNAPQAVSTGMEAEKDKANIAASQGAALAAAQKGYGDQLAVQSQFDKNTYNEMAQHVKDLDTWTKDNPYDANRFMNNMGTGKKVTTAIGLLLGGLGGGIAHTGGNAAMDYLQSEIARDVDTQKENYQRQKNVYGAYMKLYDDSNIASNLTKASLLNSMNNKVQQIASSLATPNALAQAKMFDSETALKNDELLRNSTANAALQRAGGTHIQGAGASGTWGGGTAQPQKGNGKPSASNSQPSGGKVAESSDHLLAPGAQSIMERAQYDPRFKQDAPEVQKQLEGAAMTDKAIDAINNNYDALYKNIQTNPGSEGKNPNDYNTLDMYRDAANDASGYIHRGGVGLEHIPYVGPVVGQAMKASTDTQKNREYDVKANAIKGPMVGALVHQGIAPTEAERMVESFLPEIGDTDQMRQEKKKAFIEKARAMTNTNALERHNLLRKPSQK